MLMTLLRPTQKGPAGTCLKKRAGKGHPHLKNHSNTVIKPRCSIDVLILSFLSAFFIVSSSIDVADYLKRSIDKGIFKFTIFIDPLIKIAV